MTDENKQNEADRPEGVTPQPVEPGGAEQQNADAQGETQTNAPQTDTEVETPGGTVVKETTGAEDEA